jgi:HD-like signal output (HDOD) protein
MAQRTSCPLQKRASAAEDSGRAPARQEILLDIERLDPFPATASRVLELIAQERLDPQEEIDALMPLVLSDAGITARVLRVVLSRSPDSRSSVIRARRRPR